MQQKKKKTEPRWKTEVKDWIVSIIIAIILAFVIRTFIVEPYLVEGTSMNPTLQTQERLLVNKALYYFTDPVKDDIIVFKYPHDPSRDFIKRVIAVPGDTIEIREGVVYLNGQMLKEDYILEKTKGSFPKVIVPPKHVFVMGDNRNNSEDSRFKNVGFVPYELVKGKGMIVFWPFEVFRKMP